MQRAQTQTRDYLLQDPLLSASLNGVGYIQGVGAATPQQPRFNHTLAPDFTNGRCKVLFLGADYVSADQLELV